MITYIHVKFIFDSVRLDLSSSVNMLQIADVALRVVFLLFSAIISPSFSCSQGHPTSIFGKYMFGRRFEI